MAERQDGEGTAGRRPAWFGAMASFQHADARKAVMQLVDSIVPYALLWALMVFLVRGDSSYWFVLALSIPAAGFLVRIFIVFHDCCHNSFFRSRSANTIVGFVTGALTFTSFWDWQRSHAGHHTCAGDLDRRGTGDVWTMTVTEYRAAPSTTRVAYRLFRSPLVMLLLGPTLKFVLAQRIATKGARRQDWLGVLLTNAALAAVIIVAHLTIGLRAYVLVQLPILVVGLATGVWLFYVQHQFQGVYWARHTEWSPQKAAMEGASFYRLPKVLQWFTGNIGYHHIHHLRPRIPNYALEACYRSLPALQVVRPLTLRESLRSLRLRLLDESSGRMVSFADA